MGQKKFQSIDHNQIIGNEQIVQNDMRHHYEKANTKKQNFVDGDLHQEQNSRISNSRKPYEKRDDVPNINGIDKIEHEFYQETSQRFVKKEKHNQKHTQNAFNHRREQSANPYISATANGGHSYKNSNFDEYQKNVDQYKQEQSQNSKRNSRWKNNSNVYNGGMGDNSNSTINDLSSRMNPNN